MKDVWRSVRRLKELRDSKNQNRTWLWASKDRVQPRSASDDYALAVRTMLGAPILNDPVLFLWLWEACSGRAREARTEMHGVGYDRHGIGDG